MARSRVGVEGFKDLSHREAWVIAPLMVVIVALGVYPKPLLDIINPAVVQTNSVVRDHDPTPSVPERSATNSASCQTFTGLFSPSSSAGGNRSPYTSTLTLTATGPGSICGSAK